jgi:hypothetical protein
VAWILARHLIVASPLGDARDGVIPRKGREAILVARLIRRVEKGTMIAIELWFPVCIASVSFCWRSRQRGGDGVGEPDR